MAETDSEFPGYASYLTPEARAMRDALPQNLKLAAIEIAENLAANPRAYENRTKNSAMQKMLTSMSIRIPGSKSLTG